MTNPLLTVICVAAVLLAVQLLVNRISRYILRNHYDDLAKMEILISIMSLDLFLSHLSHGSFGKALENHKRAVKPYKRP